MFRLMTLYGGANQACSKPFLGTFTFVFLVLKQILVMQRKNNDKLKISFSPELLLIS